MARRLGIGLAHGDVDGAAWVTGTGNPPLAAVDHILITLALNTRFDVGRIAGRHIRFSHGKSRADLALQQGLEPARLVLVRAITGDGFHIAGVGGRAVEHFAGPQDVAHDLGQWAYSWFVKPAPW